MVVPVVEEVKPVAQNAQVKPETQVNDVNFARQYGNYIGFDKLNLLNLTACTSPVGVFSLNVL